MRVEGNEKADESEKVVAVMSGTQGYPEQFTSQARVACTITNGKWKNAKHWF